ncbi:uncharacterized protein PADG_00043 [Paracoccidioides brasiliensis Pb18]|uniref:Uncharacterized protein n=1 Tax=Paracoccidioides brasiliensis (strain Pb18) TaxID=502780 RepID=C1FZK3_PARBD|nr:uncharacterized protein PADG_00043 [Paracoccidioides brasiliensis Pb18]EEH43754.1 hypothetical protein PADG_00043 [Paracoccidioides brasiliensis Pb18]
MQPNHLDPPCPVHDGNQERRHHTPRDATSASRESVMRSRNVSGGQHTRSEDSWIEVASQPSSSSLSSTATNDDIITTGLRVRQHRHCRAPRRSAVPHSMNGQYSNRSPSVPGSSQDEYEESDSDSDRVLSGSNEDVAARSRGDAVFLHGNSSASDAAFSSDEDDNSTAIGVSPNPPAFTPQPNAFSHPPASQTRRSRTTAFVANQAPSSSSYTTGTRRNSRSSLRSSRHTRQQQHSPYNMISPSYQADNDAALRASLSTLLSCAAAARGLSKHDTHPPTTERPEPPSFRLVPESVALGDDPGEEAARAAPPALNSATGQCFTPRSSSSKRAASPTTGHKTRRKVSLPRSCSPSSKRSRRAVGPQTSSIISPTVMTWVISAGVVVLFSAISFSAGYVLGREVGHTEAAHGLGNNGLGVLLNGTSGDGSLSSAKVGAGCGKEAVKGGLRRIRWVGGGAGSSISAS